MEEAPRRLQGGIVARAARRIIDGGEAYMVTPADLLDGVLPDVGDTRAKATAFWPLLICSSIIAACGVLADSTAVVIGAMVIAPLGTPIYGIAASLVGGRDPLPALARLVAGCVASIGVGAFVALVTFERIAVTANPQVLSRTNPTLIDLLVAVATGIAGSLALVRSDISPALPGVAIAISLVPPLTVVGITASSGEWQLASGALTLFVTNMVAIILAGLVVFAGARLAASDELPRRSRRARWTLGLGTTVVLLLLVSGTAQAVSLVREEAEIRDVATAWADEHDEWTLEGVQRSGSDVVVNFVGSGDPPDLDASRTGRQLLDHGGSDTTVIVQFEQGRIVAV